MERGGGGGGEKGKLEIERQVEFKGKPKEIQRIATGVRTVRKIGPGLIS